MQTFPRPVVEVSSKCLLEIPNAERVTERFPEVANHHIDGSQVVDISSGPDDLLQALLELG